MVGPSSESLPVSDGAWPATGVGAEAPCLLIEAAPEYTAVLQDVAAIQAGRAGHRVEAGPPGRSDVAQRFRELARTRDPALRARLIMEHHGLAQSIARRFSWPGLTADDLLQIARIGLVHAVDRYDPARGVAFATFATHTITGEIKRYLRDHGWHVKVPRHLRELHQQVRRADNLLTLRLRRAPSVAELAEHLHLSEEAILETLELGRTAVPVSLESPMPREESGEPGCLADHLGTCDDSLLDLDLRLFVRTSVEALEENQREIVLLRYFHGLTQSEVARRLSLSQMHISRLERRALERLRQLLTDLGGRR